MELGSTPEAGAGIAWARLLADDGHIEAVLRPANGTIEGGRGAAKILNLNPSTLNRMLNRDMRRPS